MFADRLRSTLEKVGQVEFKTGAEVKGIAMAGDGASIEVCSDTTPCMHW